ncbi:DUF6544 family protein [Devosia sp. RR2S18]|uniref:DUF6544 family protein n=1 Tax=Devosia rhizosphaerae TaxID=3049774 RepID=UPI0025424B70|nr:DUF6544 family protein [Devosia sp. RR2S18]WIJ26945.1 hypothetical protein QOV41_09445 [Devosia sp. RR2S18]
MIWKIAVLFLVLLIVVGAYLFVSYRQAIGEAERAWSSIEQGALPGDRIFDPNMVQGLPETARRYFIHAIAPGTPLKTTVELEMRGTFLLGDRAKFQTYEMEARQILAPPDQFVWIQSLRSGPMHITGSDALFDGEAWTRFWINSLIPVANNPSSPDLVRSAQFRSAVEGVWAPAALLPGEDIVWSQPGENLARVTITSGAAPVVLDLKLNEAGAVTEVVGQRWSNANAESIFQLQPFGGTVESEATFDGYTIPAILKVGNHFGTDEYLPFFQAEIVSARYR